MFSSRRFRLVGFVLLCSLSVHSDFETSHSASDLEYYQPLDLIIQNNIDKLKEVFSQVHVIHAKTPSNEFLFPRLTDYCGLAKNTGLTGMARRDHAVILKLLGLVEKAYRDRRFEKVMLAGGNLDRALKKHRNREGAIQYPVSDRFIHRSEWRRMLIKVYGRAINQKMI